MEEKKSVLVLVTNQRSCDHLIHAGHALALQEKRPLRVLCIQPRKALRDGCGEDLEYLFSVSKQVEAEMYVYYNDDAIATALAYIGRQGAHALVAGEPTGRDTFLKAIRNAFPHIPVHLGKEALPAASFRSVYGAQAAMVL